MLCWHYRRSDGKDDPEQEGELLDRRKLLAEIAYHTLEGWNTLPGLDETGEVVEQDLTVWVAEVLRLAAEVDRKRVAETHLGALLARFARRRSWDDWLPLTALNLLDRPENGGLREKVILGVWNARGVTSRGPFDGGEQERQLAVRYRELAARYENAHPRVSVLLISIAESYLREARREDQSAALDERWRS